MGADDLTGKTGIDQVRDPADVIDVGMGQKQVVDVCRRYRELVEGYLRIMAMGNAAVHQDSDAAAAMFRLNLDQVAGAGDAGFGTQMGDGDGMWVSTRCRILRLMKRSFLSRSLESSISNFLNFRKCRFPIRINGLMVLYVVVLSLWFVYPCISNSRILQSSKKVKLSAAISILEQR